MCFYVLARAAQNRNSHLDMCVSNYNFKVFELLTNYIFARAHLLQPDAINSCFIYLKCTNIPFNFIEHKKKLWLKLKCSSIYIGIFYKNIIFIISGRNNRHCNDNNAHINKYVKFNGYTNEKKYQMHLFFSMNE